MTRTVLYAWELGANLGHIAPFLPVAAELERRGCEVVFALRELGKVRGLFVRRRGRVLQAPWVDSSSRLPASRLMYSYADILLRCGWADAVTLTPLLGAWRDLIELVAPGLVIVDSAPAALAAVHALPAHKRPRRAVLSTGFFHPPAQTPLPTYLPWMDIPAQAVEQSDAQAHGALNEALARLGVAPVAALADVFRVERAMLTTYPELEHYDRTGAPDLVGNIVSQSAGAAPAWPAGRGPRVFAYLGVDHVHLRRLFDVLGALGWPTLMYVPGAPPDLLAQTRAPHVYVSAVPLDMRQVAAECDIGITHAGHGTVCDLLLAGKPVLALPDLVERGIVARHVVEHGLGELVRPESQNPRDLRVALEYLANDADLRERVRAFAQRHGGVSQAQTIGRVADACIDLL